jgi:hypothetical protein
VDAECSFSEYRGGQSEFLHGSKAGCKHHIFAIRLEKSDICSSTGVPWTRHTDDEVLECSAVVSPIIPREYSGCYVD